MVLGSTVSSCYVLKMTLVAWVLVVNSGANPFIVRQPLSFISGINNFKDLLHTTRVENPKTVLLSSISEETSNEEANMSIEEMNNGFRFGGVGRLYKTHHEDQNVQDEYVDIVLDCLQQSTVVVVGLGGVGSWAAEALSRSGIGHLVLVDLDDICMSNSNRQMHTLSTTVGKFKIDVLANRFRDTNPLCRISCVYDFISLENAEEILDQIQIMVQTKKGTTNKNNITAVVDAIDGSKEKAALLAACTDANIPVVTCGAAAGCLDPTRIVCADLTRVSDDKLLTTCRSNLRKYHNFPPGLPFHKRKNTKSWHLPAIYSTERVPKISSPKSSESSEDAESEEEEQESTFRLCDGELGTACFVTGSFGFTAAAQVITGIVQNTLTPPRRT